MLRILVALLCLISVPSFAADDGGKADALAAEAKAAQKTPANGPAPMPAMTPMKPPEPFAEIKQDDGKWVVMPPMMPMGGSQQCTANFQMNAIATGGGGTAGGAAAPAALPATAQAGMTFNIMRVHNTQMPQGASADSLQINMMSMILPKGATQGIAVDKDDVAVSANGSIARNANIQVTDLAAFEKKIHSGSKVVFKLDDQTKEVSSKVFGEVVEKLDACVTKAAEDAPKQKK